MKIELSHLVVNTSKEYRFNQQSTWVANMLQEITEEVNSEVVPPSEVSNSELQVSFLAQRRTESIFREYLSLVGVIRGNYPATCVRCLEPTTQKMEAAFQCCFVPISFTEMPEYKDTVSIHIDGMDMDLYFHDRGVADAQEAIHEQLFMNLDQYPLHHPDCLGLCPICGANRNIMQCIHSSAIGFS